MIAWVYGSGFPKSLDVSKAIDRAAGAEGSRGPMKRGGERLARLEDGKRDGEGRWGDEAGRDPYTYLPFTPEAQQWQGWGTALKPALETVTFASKPFTNEQERDIILSNLIQLEARLWLLSSASAAEKSSTSNQSEYGAACAIAQWGADEITSTRAALCDPMGTSLFELVTTTSLNIVSSWRRTLAESWNDGNTSTTETKSSTTTDLRTLKFSLSQITPASIIKACSLPGGFSVNASTAESHFNASLSLLQSIRTLSATERAMSQAHHEHQGAGAKPNLDPCIMARKPLIGTVAENVLSHGTGAINVDRCRVGTSKNVPASVSKHNVAAVYNGGWDKGETPGVGGHDPNLGRWPANLIHDGSEEVVGLFPETMGKVGMTKHGSGTNTKYGKFARTDQSVVNDGVTDSGCAARFFYTAKADKSDRGPGNNHPTVKPVDLMRYLVRLVCPIGGVVLDPFSGSGTTLAAAQAEGCLAIGVEREAAYCEIIKGRFHQRRLF